MTTSAPTRQSTSDNRLAIYVDGSKSVGLGHLTRMRTLVRSLKVDVRIFTRTEDICRQVFAGIDVGIVAVSHESRISDAVDRDGYGPRVMVLDPPYEPASPEACSGTAWQNEVGAIRSLGVKVARFTDEEVATAHSCDLLINDHPESGAFEITYSLIGKVHKVLAGTNYFLLDEPTRMPAVETDVVFVSFGGSDQSHLLDHYGPALDALARDFPVEVCVGAVETSDYRLSGDVTIHEFLGSQDFAERLATAKVAVTASGNTLYERVAYGSAGISVAQFPRQNRIGQALERLGVTRHLGLGSEVPPQELLETCKGLMDDESARDAQRDAAQSLNMRRGSQEIVAQIRELLA